MSDRTCPFSVDVGRYVDGELPAAEASAFERHLGDCGACQGDIQSLRTLAASISSIPTPPLLPMTLARMLEDPRIRGFGRGAAGLASGLVGLAASLLLVGVAMFYGRGQQHPERTVMNLPEPWEGAAIMLTADEQANPADRGMAEWFVSDLSRADRGLK